MSRMRLFPETNNLHLQNKFVVENKEKDILEEGVFKSYDANQIYKILLKHYNIGREEYFLRNGNDIGIAFDGCYDSDGTLVNSEIVTIILIMPKDFSDIEKIKKFFQTSGWTLAQEKQYDVSENYTIYVFQKNRQINEVEVPDILYHLTPSNKVEKILTNGLTPRTSNTMSVRNERVYFLTNKRNKFFYDYFANQLWKANLEKTLNLSGLSKIEIAEKLNQPRTMKYSVLEIDTSKCNNLKLFGDPDMDGAVWTYDNIPPQAIKLIGEV